MFSGQMQGQDKLMGFFRDVVVFDTTFNTNRYGMVFVPLLGVSNHRQTVLFGCAFLIGETTDSFVWLLGEFKKAMLGEPPKMIITNQDAAMSKAIAVTLLTTFHRYCIWHIFNKITEKPNFGECFSEMKKCIWSMDKKEEFDAKWEEIITNNGLQDHAWLSSIHAMRENWVPSYVKHVFSAGMSSSQRAESCYSFFKQYINRKNTLMEFIVCFERALASQRHKELMADHVDNNEKPPLPFQTPMQHQMGCIYTREILEMFEREDFRSLLCLFEPVDEDETHCKYKVSERVNPRVTRMKELVHDKDVDKAYCSYKGFEFWGIPCRHILAFLRMKQVEHLPDKYILKRWLQSVKSSVIYDKNHKEVNDGVDGLLLVKRSKVCKVASDLIDSALLCDEGFELLEKSFEDIRGKLTSSSSSDTVLGGPVGENLQPTQSTQDSEPTMTKSFMQEFDFTYGPAV
ncbi:protein FAR1-RELATED SEQUENCE 5-like [Prunus dulcis]|uniref:protein FAR1-RELATED SEQUENCE 5-like n=1 Tax=Prunus dulcis TaxID=3755 RepID=UPI001482207D|nr:protein FAR1-RELATED SEQUENCE 5-like [Prunus dulcis]